MTFARQFAALIVAAVVVAAGFVAYGRGARYDQAGGGAAPAPPADARPAAAAHRPQTASEPEAQSAAAAPDSGAADTDVGDILEPMAAQLADLLEHLREQCGAARRDGSVPRLSTATACVDAGEATASTVEFVRGTLTSAAGREVSDAVRIRWTRDLDAADAELRGSLTPVQRSLDRALASGAPSPAAFRDLAHLRDRIDRVLAALNRP